jgi:hypothetical protein
MAIVKTLTLKDFSEKQIEQFQFNCSKLLKQLQKEGKKNIQFIVADDFPLATMSQRGYLFGVVLKIISNDSGIEPQELFEYFKNQYGDPTFVEEVDFGKYRLSSKLYSTKMMGQFTEKIVAWGREKGLTIPEPNEVPNELYVKFYL